MVARGIARDIIPVAVLITPPRRQGLGPARGLREAAWGETYVMITLEGPHMGLNDPRSTNKVQMWNTWDVRTTEPVDHMINQVARVARGAPGGKLKNVVFRCHGSPAYLYCGAGIGRAHTRKFAA